MSPNNHSRRQLLQSIALVGLPLPLAAQSANDVPPPGDQLKDALKAFAGSAPLTEALVELSIAELVENGNSVPVRVQVNSPMSATDFVSAIALFTDRNPLHDVAQFELTPRSGRALVETRMRLATSQWIAAAVRMNDGRCFVARRHVLVTLASCTESD
jgi:sulfur-oxidizing protein SoxY